MDDSLRSSLELADLILLEDSDTLLIKSRFDITRKSSWALMLLGLGGLFLMALGIFLSEQDLFARIGISVLGGILVVLSILSILKLQYDFLKISSGKISFLHNFRVRSYDYQSDFKILIEHKTESIRSTGTLASEFRIVQIYLRTNQEKFRIIDFQMKGEYSNEADRLGRTLRQMIIKRLSSD